MSPRITVLMPVFNGELHLREAIESILAQEFRDFELLVIDDGSTDRSLDQVSSFRDPRIRVERNDRNLGLIATLNRGLALARGEFIARMDSDDISLPPRLGRQVEFLEAHQNVGICGTWSETFGEGIRSWQTRYSRFPQAVRAGLLFNTRLTHPSVMMRTEFIRKWNLNYDSSAVHAEDYDLWCRAGDCFDLSNVPEVLFRYRVHAKQVSSAHSTQQRETSDRVRGRLLEKLGIQPTREEMDIHHVLSTHAPVQGWDHLRAAGRWLDRIDSANQATSRYRRGFLRAELTQHWIRISRGLGGRYSRDLAREHWRRKWLLEGLGWKSFSGLFSFNFQ